MKFIKLRQAINCHLSVRYRLCNVIFKICDEFLTKADNAIETYKQVIRIDPHCTFLL